MSDPSLPLSVEERATVEPLPGSVEAQCSILNELLSRYEALAVSLEAENEQLRQDRLLLARLAAPTPQFFNPLAAFAAEKLRDEVLAASRSLREEPDNG